MTCASPNSSLASQCFHKHNPYLVSLYFYTIPICTLFLISRIFYLLVEHSNTNLGCIKNVESFKELVVSVGGLALVAISLLTVLQLL